MTAHGLVPEVLTTKYRTLLFMDEVTEDTLAASVHCGAHGVLSRCSGADEIIKAVRKVRTNKYLAKQLFISESTLRNHLSSIYQKFGVGNRLDLYVYVQSRLGVDVAEMA